MSTDTEADEKPTERERDRTPTQRRLEDLNMSMAEIKGKIDAALAIGSDVDELEKKHDDLQVQHNALVVKVAVIDAQTANRDGLARWVVDAAWALLLAAVAAGVWLK